ncbi:MAG: AAA family ATPase [Hyphomicrobium sp.]
MFFKRLRKDKPVEADSARSASEVLTGGGVDALPADALRVSIDAEALDLTAADGDAAIDEEVGLENALEAIEFAWDTAPGHHHVFIDCPADGTLRKALENSIRRRAAKRTTPSDWLYATDFADGARLRAIEMPAGGAHGFTQGVSLWIAELAATLPVAFSTDDYRTRRQLLDEALRAGQDDALASLDQKAAAQSIALLRTPTGYTLAPMHEGRAVKLEVFNQLPEAMRRQVEARIESLQRELETALSKAPAAARSTRREIATLNAGLLRMVAEEALAACAGPWTGGGAAEGWLAAALVDLAQQADALAESAGSPSRLAACLDRYRIQVLAAGKSSTSGVPVVSVADCSIETLTGSTRRGSGGNLSIRSGALHRAHGGVLLLDADELIAAGEAGAALCRAVTRGSVPLHRPNDLGGACQGTESEADALPFSGKVVLLGLSEAFEKLENTDARFSAAFQVRGGVASTVARNEAADHRQARQVVRLARDRGLLDIEAGGVARLLEESCRRSGSRAALSAALDSLLNVAAVADRIARAAGRKAITRSDVVEAIAGCARHSVARHGAVATAAGEGAGCVQALGCTAGDGRWIGHSQSVTAIVRSSTDLVVDVRRGREDKPDPGRAAVIGAALAEHFASAAPLGFAATVLAPSSDRTGTGAAELLAVLSALSGVVLPQGIAVAGDVDPHGALLTVSHVNERIEGHFDGGRRDDGNDDPFGVVIPRASVKCLMLREEIVVAAAEGRFHVYAVDSVFDALHILSGRTSGSRDDAGAFPDGSIERLINDRLTKWAAASRRSAPASVVKLAAPAAVRAAL